MTSANVPTSVIILEPNRSSISFDTSSYRHPRWLLHLSLFLIAFLSCYMWPAFVEAKNPKADIWKEAGGQILFSGTHTFNSGFYLPGHRRPGLPDPWSPQGVWWAQGEDWRKVQPNHRWPDVLKKVAITDNGWKFQIKGPGVLAVYVAQEGNWAGAPIVSIRDLETDKDRKIIKGQSRPPMANGERQHLIPTVNPQAWNIGPDETLTLQVVVGMTLYLNRNTGDLYYVEPQKADFDVWFFPGEGSKVIQIGKNTAVDDSPQSTDDGTHTPDGEGQNEEDAPEDPTGESDETPSVSQEEIEIQKILGQQAGWERMTDLELQNYLRNKPKETTIGPQTPSATLEGDDTIKISRIMFQALTNPLDDLPESLSSDLAEGKFRPELPIDKVLLTKGYDGRVYAAHYRYNPMIGVPILLNVYRKGTPIRITPPPIWSIPKNAPNSNEKIAQLNRILQEIKDKSPSELGRNMTQADKDRLLRTIYGELENVSRQIP